jgi:hypothetical protein
MREVLKSTSLYNHLSSSSLFSPTSSCKYLWTGVHFNSIITVNYILPNVHRLKGQTIVHDPSDGWD